MLAVDVEHVRAVAKGPRGAQATAVGPKQAQILLWGALPVGWAGQLATGLARYGLDTRRAMACRNGSHGWLAEFEVAHPPDVDPARLDYISMSQEEQTNVDSKLSLHRYSLRRSTKDGSLTLVVEAPDRTGFLASVLSRLAFFSLFPAAMRITTIAGRAFDEFCLRGVAGGEPGTGSEKALAQYLSQAQTRRLSAARTV